MSFFNPEIPLKQKEESHHPWESRINNVYSRTYKYGHNSARNPSYPTKKEKVPKQGLIKFTVIGNRVTKDFIYCLYLVKGLYKYKQKQFEAPVIRGVTGVEWPKVLNDLKIQYGNLAYCLRSQVAILINDQLLGGINELKDLIETRYVYNVRVNYYKEGIQQFANYIRSSGRPCAYLHISINEEPIGVLIFMLYSDLVPETCENFLRLCGATKGGYAGTPVHRIVKDCWIQCGGFGLKNKGSLGCENFSVPHDRRGVLCMANDGRHVDCLTQFFVLLQPAVWMKSKYVAFGQLIEGEKTLERIENSPTWYESPTSEIKIVKAGVFNMDCQWRPINKNANAHIQAHIEDLYVIGELFYEALLEKVFLEIKFRELQTLEGEGLTEEDDKQELVQSVHQTKRFLSKKEDIDRHLAEVVAPAPTMSDKVTENNDFDVDEYAYEFEEYSYKRATFVPSSLVVMPEKAFYLPMTDVPYPGEVDSVFNLKKLLKGDYCLESDLEPSHAKRKKSEGVKLKVPDAVLDVLYDSIAPEDEENASLNSEDEELVKDYLRDNVDTVSFAGPTIKKMARVSKKFEIFEDAQGEKKDLISDEELRLIR
ncbi:uncharacterized protein LOC142977587 [Anticarsia gemmatalis]|uniref:uncharacterized protein LOC142977587 n=1 Tax=Anticarsia gemmatalis TaxID=129554 RepID=UPI003F75B725